MTRGYQIVLVKPADFEFVEGFRNVMESLQEGLLELGHSAPIRVNQLAADATPILFGAHHLDPPSAARLPADTVIYNLEQLAAGYPWFVPPYLELLRRHRVWDFSRRNLAFLRDSGIAPGARWVPVGYSPCLTRIAPAPQDVDVLFFGVKSPRRLKVLAALGEAGLKVVALNNVWGRERDSWISRAKIVLNMHNQDNGEFEVVRVLYLLANRKAVVCEVNDPNQLPIDLRQAVIPSSADDMVAACLAAVRHEGLRNVVAAAGFHAVTEPRRHYANILRTILASRDAEEPGEYPQPPIRTIAIATAAQLGDLLACEPVIRHLRRQFPAGRITLIAHRHYADIMAHHPALDEIRPVAGLGECVALANAQAYDVWVDLNLDGWRCEVTGQTLRKPSAWLPINADNYYLFGPLLPIFCLAGGLPPLVDAPRLHIDPSTVARVDTLDLPDRYAILHCQSSEPARNWTEEKWRQLAEALASEFGLPLFEIGLEATVRSERVSSKFCGTLSLLESAEVIRRAACFIGIDSGPAHMAVATRTPAVVIAGEFRRFKAYFPYTGEFAHSPGLRYLLNSDGPAAAISPAAVLAAVTSQLRSATHAPPPAAVPRH